MVENREEYPLAWNEPQPSVADNSKDTVRVIHDVFKSYYHVARKRFVSTVWMLVTD